MRKSRTSTAPRRLDGSRRPAWSIAAWRTPDLLRRAAVDPVAAKALAVWPLTFSAVNDQLALLHTELERGKGEMFASLRKADFTAAEMTASSPSITDQHAERQYGGALPPARYLGTLTVTLRSNQVGKLKALTSQAGALIERGVVLASGGQPGVGKSYLASALGQAACRKGLRVAYRRVAAGSSTNSLWDRADGSYTRVLERLARVDVLVLDDLGLGTPKDAQRHDLLEVLKDRYGRVSTIITSQLEIKKWHEWIGAPTVADAILDRVVHNAYKLALTGPSGPFGYMSRAAASPRPRRRRAGTRQWIIDR